MKKVYFQEYGYIPLGDWGKNAPIFKSFPPRRIGDDAVATIRGRRTIVRLLKAIDGKTYIVDIKKCQKVRFKFPYWD